MKSRSASFLIITAIYLFSGVAGALLYRHLPYAYWMNLLLFVFVFSALATITLEFIDKDKR